MRKRVEGINTFLIVYTEQVHINLVKVQKPSISPCNSSGMCTHSVTQKKKISPHNPFITEQTTSLKTGFTKTVPISSMHIIGSSFSDTLNIQYVIV